MDTSYLSNLNPSPPKSPNSGGLHRQSQPQERIPGRLRGQFTVPNNFNEPDEELIRLFEGEED